jgi:hypothetical protein
MWRRRVVAAYVYRYKSITNDKGRQFGISAVNRAS